MKSKILNLESGFTLIELIVAIGLFTVIVFISLGSLLSIYDANRRAQSSRAIVDNLNISIENMERTVRYGNSYHCGSSGSLTTPSDCSAGDTLLAFGFQGDTIVYRLKPGGITIQRSDDGGSNYTDITSPETVIEYLKFYVLGTNTDPNTNQPYVVAVIKGHVGNKATVQSSFSIEAMMSQRNLDI